MSLHRTTVHAGDEIEPREPRGQRVPHEALMCICALTSLATLVRASFLHLISAGS